MEGRISLDYGEAYAAVAKSRTGGSRRALSDEEERHQEVRRPGAFLDDHTLQVTSNDGATETVTFAHCIIAAGATTKLLPGTSPRDRVVTYEELILTETLPGSIVIAGAGAVGVEFAYVLRSYDVDVPWSSSSTASLPTEDPRFPRNFPAVQTAGHQGADSTRVESIDDSDRTRR